MEDEGGNVEGTGPDVEEQQRALPAVWRVGVAGELGGDLRVKF
jgi:hypothetical protein